MFAQRFTKVRVSGSRSAALSLAGCLTFGALFVAGVPAAHAAPALEAYVSQPFVQGPDVSGVDIETFDSECPDTWWQGGSNPGTMTGSCSSVDGDVYGGASTTSGTPTLGDGTGQTRYGAVYDGATVTVTLAQPASYLGFQWSAGDGNNLLTLFSSGTTVATFTTQDLLAMLYYDDMGDWSAIDYFINPAINEWIGEPFAYLYLVGSGGLTFDSFSISQPVYGFEFDNFSVGDTPVTINPATAIRIGDEIPPDENGNGIDDTTEDSDGDGIKDPFEDSDGDGISDVFEDSDGDGINDFAESETLADTGVDVWSAFGTATLLIGAGVALALRRRRQRA